MSFDTNVQEVPACMVISALTNYIFVKGSSITQSNYNMIIDYGSKIYKKYIDKNNIKNNYLTYTDLGKIFATNFSDIESYTIFPKADVSRTYYYKIAKNLDEFLLYIHTIIKSNKNNNGRIGMLVLCDVYAISILLDFRNLRQGAPYIFIRDSHRREQNDFYDDDKTNYGILKILLKIDVPNECFGENKQINVLLFTTKDALLPKFNFELDKILDTKMSNNENNIISECMLELILMYKNLSNDDKKIWNILAESYLESKKIGKSLINKILTVFNKNLPKITDHHTIRHVSHSQRGLLLM